MDEAQHRVITKQFAELKMKFALQEKILKKSKLDYNNLELEYNRVTRYAKKMNALVLGTCNTVMVLVKSCENLMCEVRNFENNQEMFFAPGSSQNRDSNPQKSYTQKAAIVGPLAVNGHVIHHPTVNIERMSNLVPQSVIQEQANDEEVSGGEQSEIASLEEENREYSDHDPEDHEEVATTEYVVVERRSSNAANNLNQDEEEEQEQEDQENNEEWFRPNLTTIVEEGSNTKSAVNFTNHSASLKENRICTNNTLIEVDSTEVNNLSNTLCQQNSQNRSEVGFTENILIHSTPVPNVSSISNKRREADSSSSVFQYTDNNRKSKNLMGTLEKYTSNKRGSRERSRPSEVLKECKVVIERTNFNELNKNVTNKRKKPEELVKKNCFVHIDRISLEETNGISINSSSHRQKSGTNKENTFSFKRNSDRESVKRERSSDDDIDSSNSPLGKRTRRKRQVSYQEAKLNTKLRRP